jgi:hypothetical protein
MAEKQYEHVKAWRDRKKNQLVNLFGNKCGICSYNYSKEAFDFHHLDPSEKESTIAGISSLKRFAEEVVKCAMLCANCHREVHAGIRVCPADIKRVSLKEALEAMPSEKQKPRIQMPPVEIVRLMSSKQLAIKYGVCEITAHRWRKRLCPETIKNQDHLRKKTPVQFAH